MLKKFIVRGIHSTSAALTVPFQKDSVLKNAISLKGPKYSWTKEEIKEIYDTPLLELIYSAQIQHRRYHDPTKIQLCSLLNIKTGGCSEDCKYCPQSTSNNTGLKAGKLVTVEEVEAAAKEAKLNGATRFCMGAAWRDMAGRKSALKRISEMIAKVNELGLESCVTLGMINKEQINQLNDAGLTAYNHNIDTSREHYKNIISTRTYDDRLETIKNVQESGINVCTGGILGLGETHEDHVSFLYTLSNITPHPESVPINRLVPVAGTAIVEELKKPGSKKLEFEEIIRTMATARILMPRSIIKLAAGRYTMKEYEQFLCFMAGCNSIFTGKKMLTTNCNDWNDDKRMLQKWGLEPMKAFQKPALLA